jgi:hypothetical protein
VTESGYWEFFCLSFLIFTPNLSYSLSVLRNGGVCQKWCWILDQIGVGRPLKRPLDDVETGLSRSNWCRMMVMYPQNRIHDKQMNAHVVKNFLRSLQSKFHYRSHKSLWWVFIILSDKCSLHHDVYTVCPESDYHDIVLTLWKTPGVSVEEGIRILQGY